MDLLDMISDSVVQNTQRNVSLSPILQLLIALRYYATGAFQVCHDFLFNVYLQFIWCSNQCYNLGSFR